MNKEQTRSALEQLKEIIMANIEEKKPIVRLLKQYNELADSLGGSGD